MPYPTSSIPYLLWGFLPSKDFIFEPSSSSNRSPIISTDSYATLLSFMFIACNATQRWQLWTVTDFLACNPKKPAPLIAIVTIILHVKIMPLLRSRLYPFASIPIAQSSINKPSSLIRKRSRIDSIRKESIGFNSNFNLIHSPDF